jgi:hypothetical protein
MQGKRLGILVGKWVDEKEIKVVNVVGEKLRM